MTLRARCFVCKTLIEQTSEHASVLTMASIQTYFCGLRCLGRHIASIEKQYRDKLDEAGE